MPKRAALVEAEIHRRLAAAVAPDSPNHFVSGEVRSLAREYLMNVDRENERDPEDADLPHWNLWMNDARYQDALFVVLIFRHEAIEFFCGTGESFAIMRFSQHHEGEPDNVFAIMSQQFDIPEPPLRIERTAAAMWLGRGWKP
jgi:hypothetical protein